MKAILSPPLLFLCISLVAQEAPGESSADTALAGGISLDESSADESSAAAPDMSLWTLLSSATGPAWRPDWPPDLPPDLFYAPGAVSVSVEFDDGAVIELARAGERFRAFPLLVRIPGEEGPQTLLVQGRCEFDPRGRLRKLLWGESDAEVLQWDAESRPVLFRIFSGGYYFAALEYLEDKVLEVWYHREGAILCMVMSDSGEQKRFMPDSDDPAELERSIRLYRDNGGRITGIETRELSVSARYSARGLPRYLERTIPADSSGEGAKTETYRYQWDEAGRLVRFNGGGESLDYRYEYTVDSRGNWTERRELRMQTLGSGDDRRLTPARIRLIKRRIRYEEP
ncbi:MAG: hypothetical protein LBP60_02780 [Spirochaetaceae bacterium]|jgi:hypothetical protein|nr:hypothetical protein [Spirochaetaceae bacterium]